MSDFNAYEELKKVEHGEVNPIEAYVKVRAEISELEEIKKQLEDHVYDEVDKYDKKEDAVAFGHRVSIVSRNNYSYKHSNLWKQANAEKKRIQEIMKSNAKNGTEAVDEETGEVIPPAEISTSTYLKMESL